jgi:hypothetical protein
MALLEDGRFAGLSRSRKRYIVSESISINAGDSEKVAHVCQSLLIARKHYSMRRDSAALRRAATTDRKAAPVTLKERRKEESVPPGWAVSPGRR